MLLNMEARHWNMMVFPSLGQWLPQVIDGWNRETKLERHSVAEIALKERKEADFRWKYYLWFKAEQSCVSNHPVPGRFSKDACDGHTETAELIHGCSRLQAELSSCFQWTRKIKHMFSVWVFFFFFQTPLTPIEPLTVQSIAVILIQCWILQTIVTGFFLCMVPRGFVTPAGDFL